MMADFSEETVLDSSHYPVWGNSSVYRDEIGAIVFGKSLSDAGENAWDISEKQNGSIMAWVDGDTLYVGAKGKISPNKCADYLFAYFENVRRIEFNDALDTSNVTSMVFMFESCHSLTSLDVSGFDMSCVNNDDDMLNGVTCEIIK